MSILRQQLKNLERQPLIIESEIGKGGEGSVYSIKNAPNLVVKVYHSSPSSDKEKKILSMIRQGNDRILSLTTWPLASYYTEKGIFSGFIMPRLNDYYPLYELYSPKLRLEKFPKADWRFLIHTATNTARAFSGIHNEGHVIGDINHGNLLVAQDATVKFIDADSFQIHDNQKYWLCEVGVLTHQPPEMQGLSTFSGLIRTPNHDNFGLAVLIFQLLFLARHPFSGRFLGMGEMPLEKAIAEYRFAYSSNCQMLQTSPPPSSLSMEALTPHLRLLFERAFSKEGSGEKVGLRPTADEWITALTTLATSLKCCLSNGGHYYYKELSDCPWCAIETSGNIKLFIEKKANSTEKIDIDKYWQLLDSIEKLGPEPPPHLTFKSFPASLKAQAILRKLDSFRSNSFVFSILILMATFILGTLGPGWQMLGILSTLSFPLAALIYYFQYKEKISIEITEKIDECKIQWDKMTNEWEIKNPLSYLQKSRHHIDNLKKEYKNISLYREQLIQKVKNKSYQEQLRLYLRKFPINSANIDGIGPERLATLKINGIETSADIEEWRLKGIRGFGNVFCARLTAWKKQIEKNFSFNERVNLAEIDHEVVIKQHQLAQEISKSVSQLSSFTKQIQECRKTMNLKADELLSAYSQAIADAHAIGLEY